MKEFVHVHFRFMGAEALKGVSFDKGHRDKGVGCTHKASCVRCSVRSFFEVIPSTSHGFFFGFIHIGAFWVNLMSRSNGLRGSGKGTMMLDVRWVIKRAEQFAVDRDGFAFMQHASSRQSSVHAEDSASNFLILCFSFELEAGRDEFTIDPISRKVNGVAASKKFSSFDLALKDALFE